MHLAATRPRVLVGLGVLAGAGGIALLLREQSPPPPSPPSAAPAVVRATAAPSVPTKRERDVPTRSVPCVGSEPELLAADGHVVLCSGRGCVALEGSTGTLDVSPTSRPLAAPPGTTKVVDQGGAVSVCVADRCARVGRELTAALAASDGAPAIQATTDLRVVVLDKQAWDRRRDRPLELVDPARSGDAASGEMSVLDEIAVAGHWLVVSWGHCAGPCASATVVDARGRPRGPGLEGLASVLELGANRFALVGDHGGVDLLSDSRGTIVAHYQLETYPVWDYDPVGVAVDADTIAIMREGMGEAFVTVSELGISDDHFWLRAENQLPICDAP